MKNFKVIILLSVFTALLACENEVDLTGEKQDITVVYGLLDASDDEHYIKISRAFLEEGTDATVLASNPDNLYYDSLEVNLIDLSTKEKFNLNTVNIPREDGLFPSETNILYELDTALTINNSYQLEVIQPDGKVIKGTTRILDNVELTSPLVNRQDFSFATNSGLRDQKMEFSHSENVARFEVIMFFHYREEINGIEYPDSVRIPVGTSINRSLESKNDIELVLTSDEFFSTIASKVPETNTRKEIPTGRNSGNNSISIEITAADEDYDFYRNLNGPIDGIAQVRPEYTNIENGIGLLASRSFVRYTGRINLETRTELKSGSYTANHNFVDPN